MCKICQKGFARRWNLTNHMQVHKKTREKTVCPQCDKTFFAVSNLRQHIMQFHSNLAPESIFIDNLNWQSMKKNYSKDLPTCVVCKRSFPKKYNLQLHMEAFHTGRRLKMICKDCGCVYKSMEFVETSEKIWL